MADMQVLGMRFLCVCQRIEQYIPFPSLMLHMSVKTGHMKCTRPGLVNVLYEYN